MTQEKIFGKGKFVQANEYCLSPCFRGTFEGKKGEKTTITICGLGCFRFFINGQNPTDDIFAPVTSFYHDYDRLYNKINYGEEMASRIYAVEYDITDYVIDGVNSICAIVGAGWYFKEYYGDCVLCYKIVCGDKEFYSDENIKWIDSPLVFNKDKELEDTFYQMKRGETHDYTKHNYDSKWLLSDFDDGDWKSTVVRELPETEYFIQNCPNDRIIRSLEPTLIKETDEYKIYDFKENVSGWYIFKCGKYGEKVTVICGEAVDENNELVEKNTGDQMSQYICDASDREYHPLFTWQAFRYVQISNNAKLLRMDVIHTPAKIKTSFKSENEVLSWIYDAYIRTQLCNLHEGIPSDCPHLERLGYTGDGQLTCEAAMLNLELKKFYLKWMEDISDCQDRNSGFVQYTAPYWKCGGGPGGWGCAIVEVPYQFYRMYGDLEPMKKYFGQMLHYLEYLENHSARDIVISTQPGLWCLGEWCTPEMLKYFGYNKPKISDAFVNTYFYVKSIDRMLEVADKIGMQEHIEKLRETRQRKIDAINYFFFDKRSGNFDDNSNCANAFALDLGLGDERTLQNLVDSAKGSIINTGIFGTELVARILFDNGYGDIETEILSRTEYPSFGNMMKNNATTLWEEWYDPRSMSHPMFGSVAKYLIYNLLGIRQAKDSVGFKKILIDPQPNKYSGDCEGHLELDCGKIEVKTNLKNGTAAVTVPENANAYYLDGDKEVKLDAGTTTINLNKIYF